MLNLHCVQYIRDSDKIKIREYFSSEKLAEKYILNELSESEQETAKIIF